MAIYLLDGRICPALFLDGNPRRAVYFYKSTEGDAPVEMRLSNSLVFVGEDNGSSWNASNYPTGANFVLIVPDNTEPQDVLNRLVNAYNNRKRAYEAAQAGNVGGDSGSVTEGEVSVQGHTTTGDNVTPEAPVNKHPFRPWKNK